MYGRGLSGILQVVQDARKTSVLRPAGNARGEAVGSRRGCLAACMGAFGQYGS